GWGRSRVREAAACGALGARSGGEQHEVQLYAAGWHVDWQLQGQLAAGGFEREMQRNLLLGNARDTVGTTLSGRYQSAFVEAGRRFDVAGVALTPYLG